MIFWKKFFFSILRFCDQLLIHIKTKLFFFNKDCSKVKDKKKYYINWKELPENATQWWKYLRIPPFGAGRILKCLSFLALMQLHATFQKFVFVITKPLIIKCKIKSTTSPIPTFVVAKSKSDFALLLQNFSKNLKDSANPHHLATDLV